jgi:glycosyltransferase involved in cell wall biosynthesis
MTHASDATLTPVQRRIRVLHLGSPTGLYGAERWILALLNHLPRDRIESWVGVIKDSPSVKAELCQEAAARGVPAKIFEAQGKLSLAAIGEMRRFILSNRIDLLHTHGYKTDIIGRLSTLGTACKVIATPHGWSLNAGIKLRLYEMLDRLAFLSLDAVAPLSMDLFEELRLIPGLRGKLHFIANAVDFDDLTSADEPPPELAELRARGTLIIGYIGQLIRRKRVDVLIKAFHELDIASKHLCIVGDGAERADLERLTASLGESARVTFFGYRNDRVALLKAFDLFVLPSELEGIPRCLMEAMGAGVACIASDIPGSRDLIESGATGLLFPPGDVAALTTEMGALARDLIARRALATRGEEHVRAAHSAEAMAGRYVRLYEQRLFGNAAPGAADANG